MPTSNKKEIGNINKFVFTPQESDTVINGIIKFFSLANYIKIIEMILCRINFSFVFKPVFSLLLMLK